MDRLFFAVFVGLYVGRVGRDQIGRIDVHEAADPDLGIEPARRLDAVERLLGRADQARTRCQLHRRAEEISVTLDRLELAGVDKNGGSCISAVLAHIVFDRLKQHLAARQRPTSADAHQRAGHVDVADGHTAAERHQLIAIDSSGRQRGRYDAIVIRRVTIACAELEDDVRSTAKPPHLNEITCIDQPHAVGIAGIEADRVKFFERPIDRIGRRIINADARRIGRALVVLLDVKRDPKLTEVEPLAVFTDHQPALAKPLSHSSTPVT